MTTCFSCQTELPERAVFCKTCGIQVRCKNPECRDVLEADAQNCVTCGMAVNGGTTLTPVSNGHGQLTPAVNKLEFDATPKSRSLRASLTDRAVESLSNSLGTFIANRAVPTARDRRRGNGDLAFDDDRQLPLIDVEPEIPIQDGAAAAAEVLSKTALPAASVEADGAKLRELFRYNGTKIKLIDSRLKANSQQDFVRRLTVLFLYAHELEGREFVPRADLNTALSEAKVYDGNARHWIANSNLLSTEGESVSLSVPGHELAVEVLKELRDPSIVRTWSLGSKGGGRAAKAGSADGKESGKAAKAGHRKGGRPSKVVSEWVPKWKALGLPIDGHEVLRTRTTGERGLFGLWAIRKALGDAGKVVSLGLLRDFLYHAFETKVHERSLERDFKDKEMKERVLHVEGTKYQILPPGMQEAEKMASSTKGASSSHASSKGSVKK